jgi:imidazole glycerol-phosphate synthase subunit HisF
MLKKRIIPCLDVKDGRTVKGVNFVGLRDAGDSVELAYNYSIQGADELVLLDITATHERRKTTVQLVTEVAKQIRIPFTVGGGISSLADAEKLLQAGADKVSINSAAVKNPQLISDIAKQYGEQCVVVAIDTNHASEGKNFTHEVVIAGGRTYTGLDTFAWAKQVYNLGAGEILLTSMTADGTKQGFDIPTLQRMEQEVGIPIIASGGAGNAHHFVELFTNTTISAGLAASIFHFNELPVPELKKELHKHNILVRI